MNKDIEVSVCCLAYNHEKYIEIMLESLIKQKTNFKYEIIIHDDASTDKTTEIIKRYEKKYPNLIRPIFQKENQYSKGVEILTTYVYPQIKGKYVAFCEGDDYWTDERKLQKQYDAMETNVSCSICSHYVQAIREDGDLMKDIIPGYKLTNGVISSKVYANWLLANAQCTFQLSSYFIRAKYINEIIKEIPGFMKVSKAGDEALQRYCLNKGNLYFINDIMSCYRVNSIGSWTLREHSTIEGKEKHCESMKKMDYMFNEFSKYKFNSEIIEGVEYRDFLMLIDKKDYISLKDERFNKSWKKRSYKSRTKLNLLIFYYKLKKLIN